MTPGRSRSGGGPIRFYNLHDVVTVASAVTLDDLARFEVDDGHGEADLQLVTGRPSIGTSDTEVSSRHPGATIGRSGNRISARINAPQSWAPRLVYASVVEPLLQRLFYERGHALVHAACVSRSGEGLLVVGESGTGKTTLALELARGGAAFLGDDMIVLGNGGRALAFPKHVKVLASTQPTTHAGMLGGRARGVRRALHSRGGALGRRAGRLGSPAINLDALVQALVPPPRFDIAEIDRRIEVVDSVQLSAVVLLDGAALATTATNTEVAARIAATTERAFSAMLWNHVALAHAPRADAVAARVAQLLPSHLDRVRRGHAEIGTVLTGSPSQR